MFASLTFAQSIDTSLVVFYCPFDSSYVDKSSNDLELNIFGDVQFGEGKFGKAAEFNGIDQYIDIDKTDLLNPSISSFSVCVWIKNTSTAAFSGTVLEDVVLAQKDNSGTGRIYLYTKFDGANNQFNNFLGGNANYSSANSFARDSWTHLAVVCDPTDQSITYYINGALDTTEIALKPFESTSGGFRIGAHKANKNYWTGSIDDLLLTTEVLDSVAIGSIYKDGVGQFYKQPPIIIEPNSIAKLLNISNLYYANSSLKLTSNIKLQNARYKIVNANGQVVKSGIVNAFGNNISISAKLNNGIYLMSIETNGIISTKKFIAYE